MLASDVEDLLKFPTFRSLVYTRTPSVAILLGDFLRQALICLRSFYRSQAFVRAQKQRRYPGASDGCADETARGVVPPSRKCRLSRPGRAPAVSQLFPSAAAVTITMGGKNKQRTKGNLRVSAPCPWGPGPVLLERPAGGLDGEGGGAWALALGLRALLSGLMPSFTCRCPGDWVVGSRRRPLLAGGAVFWPGFAGDSWPGPLLQGSVPAASVEFVRAFQGRVRAGGVTGKSLRM